MSTTDSPGQQTPWLLDLATRQVEPAATPVRLAYDDEQQMTFVREPAQELAIDWSGGVMSKKADREKGEDQKGN
jgi:hypothetical protein